MSSNRLIWTGVAGAAVAAICCFTPALVVVLGGIGLSAWLAWADKLVLPAAAVFIAIAVLGFYRLRHGSGRVVCGDRSDRGPENKSGTQT
jgi:mercuric ion transport protein